MDDSIKLSLLESDRSNRNFMYLGLC